MLADDGQAAEAAGARALELRVALGGGDGALLLKRDETTSLIVCAE